MATTEDAKNPAAETPAAPSAPAVAVAVATPVPAPEAGGAPDERLPSASAEDASPKPFIPKQPIREEMVRQAISFLTHPKVKGSPIKFRRAFLEKKGLTGEEIDKAFQQVPDEATGDADTDTSSAGNAYITSHAARPSAAAPVTTATVTAPAAAATPSLPQTATATVGPLQPPPPGMGAPGMPYGHQHPMQGGSGMPMAYPGQQVHPARKWTWGQMAVALAVVGAAGAGTAALAQRFAWPRLKLWLLQQLKEEQKGKEGPSVEATTANTAAAGEGGAPGDKESLGALMSELRTMAAELKSAKEGQNAGLTSADIRKEVLSCMSVMKEFQPHSPLDPYTNEADRFLARAAKGPAQSQPQPQGQGVPGDTERARRLEKEVEDLKRLLRSRGAQGTPQDPSYPQGGPSSAFPSSVNSFSSGPGYTTAPGSAYGSGGVSPGVGSGYAGAPGLAPGGSGAGASGVPAGAGHLGYGAGGDRRQGGGVSLSSSTSSLTGAPQGPAGGAPQEPAEGAFEAPMSKSYMEILDMVRRGETPPGIRDINDKPPNPNQPLSASQLAPRAKPWDQQQATHAASAAGRPGPLPGARPQAGGSATGVPPWLRSPSGTQSSSPSPGLHAGHTLYGPRGELAGQGQGPLGLGQGHAGLGGVAPTAEALASAAAMAGSGAALYNSPGPDSWQQATPAAGSALGVGAYPGLTQGLPGAGEPQQVGSMPGVDSQPGNPHSASGAGGAGGVPAAYQSVSPSSWVPPSVPKPAMAEAAAAMRRFPQGQGQNPWLSSMGTSGAPRPAQGAPGAGAGAGAGAVGGGGAVAQAAQANGQGEPAADGAPKEHQGLTNGVGSSGGAAPPGPGLGGFPTPAEAYRQAGGPPAAHHPDADAPASGAPKQGPPGSGEPQDFSYGSPAFGDGSSSGGGAHGGPPRPGAYAPSSSGAGAHGGQLGGGPYGAGSSAAGAGAYGSVASAVGAHYGAGEHGGPGPSGAGAPEPGAGPPGLGPEGAQEDVGQGVSAWPAGGAPFPPAAASEGEARGGEGGEGGAGRGGGSEGGHAQSAGMQEPPAEGTA